MRPSSPNRLSVVSRQVSSPSRASAPVSPDAIQRGSGVLDSTLVAASTSDGGEGQTAGDVDRVEVELELRQADDLPTVGRPRRHHARQPGQDGDSRQHEDGHPVPAHHETFHHRRATRARLVASAGRTTPSMPAKRPAAVANSSRLATIIR